MSRTTKIVTPVVAVLAALLLGFTLATFGSPALAVEDCIAAPKPPAPAGSHWYYRTDRATGRKCWFVGSKDANAEQAEPRAPAQVQSAADCLAAPGPRAPEGSRWHYRTDRATQRKCWYLGRQDRKVENAAPRALAQIERTADQIERTAESATVAEGRSAPSAEEQLTQRTQPEQEPVPPWPATNAGDTAFAAAGAVQWLDPVDTKPDEAPTHARGGEENRIFASRDSDGPGALVEPPAQQSVVVADTTAYSFAAAQVPLLLVVTGALGLVGLLMRAIYDVVAARRLQVHVQPYDASPGGTTCQSPVPSTVSMRSPPLLPPMEPIHRHDDVEDALRHFSRSWNRRAA
jgi:hypothetical protein